MKVNITKNQIRLTHALLSAIADDPDLLASVIEACALCFDMSQSETEYTIKALDHKVCQALKMSLTGVAA